MGENNAASGGCSSTNGLPMTSGQYSAEYLAQLLKDKKQLGAFPNIFLHLERLVDDEINKVRVSLFQLDTNKETLVLPDAVGQIVTLQEKVYVPVKEFPDYNFVGRILGPRGMTAKQLEQETGCKIMVRGRGSMRDKKKEEQNRGKPNWEHLSDELHVLVQCEDSENRARMKLQRATEEIKKLLVPAPEGEDELKRKQLMELAIINGTYRPANQGSRLTPPAPRLMAPMTLASPLRSPTLGAPIILSPTRLGSGMGQSSLGNGLAGMPSLVHSTHNDLTAAAAAAGLIYSMSYSPLDPTLAAAAAAYPYSAAAAAAALASPLLGGEYPTLDHQAGALFNQRRILGQTREHPYQRPSSLKSPVS